MDRSEVIKPKAKKKIKEGHQGGKKKEGPIEVEEEEGGRKVEEGDDLDLVPAPKAAPVELVLSSNGTKDDRAPRSQKKIFINV